MNKTEWKNYKKNNLKLVWRTANIGWNSTLPFKRPLMQFLKKNFSPENMYYKIQKLKFMISKKAVVPCLEYVVTTKCTMNCKHCNTFIPYFNEKTHCKPVTFEVFKKDIDTFLKAVDYIDYFGFVGGEPLLAKDLAKMIKYVCSKRKIHHIFLATNCTMNLSKELLNSMKNKKFAVQLSDYRDAKLKNGLTVKYQEYKKILSENGILFSHPQEDGERMTFQSMPELYQDQQNPEKMRRVFDNCWGQYCQMLCDGILTQCTLSVFISRTMELTPDIKSELVNIREKKSSRKLADEIIKFYAKPYSAFCNYCHTDNIIYGLPVGEQVEEACKI